MPLGRLLILTALLLLSKDAPYPRHNSVQPNCREKIQVTASTFQTPLSPPNNKPINSLEVCPWPPRAGLAQGCPTATLVPGKVHSIPSNQPVREPRELEEVADARQELSEFVSPNEKRNQVTMVTPSRETMEITLKVWGSRYCQEGSCPCPRRALSILATHKAPWGQKKWLCCLPRWWKMKNWARASCQPAGKSTRADAGEDNPVPRSSEAPALPRGAGTSRV